MTVQGGVTLKTNIRKILSLLLCSVMLFGSVIGVFAYSTGDDYPTEYKDAVKDSTFDRWGFPNRECTSFVCWCLESRNGVKVTNFSVDGKSIKGGNYDGFMLGEAKNWGAVFETMGYKVDANPAVGAVLWTGSGTSGHVAWVKSIEGDMVTSEEYNNSYATKQVKGVEAKGEFGSQTKSASDWVKGGYKFIHIRDIGETHIIDNTSPINTDNTGTSIWKLVIDFIMTVIRIISNLISSYA